MLFAVDDDYLTEPEHPENAMEDMPIREDISSEFSSLVDDLRNSDPSVRMKASEKLGRMPFKSLQSLHELLNDDDPNVKIGIIRALGEIKSVESAKPLEKLLMSEILDIKSDEICRMTIDSLGEIASVESVKVLCKLSKDASETIRYSAIRALGNIGSPKSMTYLVEALCDSESIVRLKAVEAIGNMSEKSLWAPVTDMLNDSSCAVRMRAAITLGKLGEQKALGFIYPMLGSRIDSERVAASQAVGELGCDESAMEYLSVAAAIEGKEDVEEALLDAIAKVKARM